MYDGEIISYSISEHPVLNQVMDMLDKAFDKITDDTGLILHSDQAGSINTEDIKNSLKIRV